MSRRFTYEALPQRVRFVDDAPAAVAEEAERLGCARLLLLSTPDRAAQAIAVAAQAPIAAHFAGAVMHTPVEVTAEAVAAARAIDADGLLAVGGGSTIGLGKAIACTTGLPQTVVPTTYAGSEATPILGQTENGRKTTRRGPDILPEIIIYDAALTLTLGIPTSMASGLNAIAHAAEALYARDANPVTSLLAVEAIRVLATALPMIARDPRDRAARAEAQYGAWLCGTCLGQVGMALHHKLCHTLGGSFGLPHAPVHAAILPHALSYTLPAAPGAARALAAALGDAAADPARLLFDLAGRLGVERRLRVLGLAERDLDRAADLAVADPYWNPRPIERDAVRALLARAWAGSPPQP